MKDLYEQIKEVNGFLKEKEMQAFDLMRIAKMLCCCGTCKFFVQHYSKDRKALDWGHCCKGNIQHSKRISTASCGSWDYETAEIEEPNTDRDRNRRCVICNAVLHGPYCTMCGKKHKWDEEE